jgi:aspartyl-tRNA(Asn)/glutamyl-tRNA(Gln) amidotransferase subunit A
LRPAPSHAGADLGRHHIDAGAPGAVDWYGTITANRRVINYLGLPSVSFPCGFDSAGLPIGVQITGRPFGKGPVL